MRLLVLADDDAAAARAVAGASADVVVACGDLADATIVGACRSLGVAHAVAVKGNHDDAGRFAPPIVDLHRTTHVIDGVRFGGFGGAWRYKPRGHHLFDQWEVDDALAGFPPVDVFIAHNAPRGIHDRDDGVHVGFDAFLAYIDRCRPRLFLHGHQHVNRETRRGETRIIGVYGGRAIDLS